MSKYLTLIVFASSSEVVVFLNVLFAVYKSFFPISYMRLARVLLPWLTSVRIAANVVISFPEMSGFYYA